MFYFHFICCHFLPLSSLWFSSPDFFLLSLSLPVGFRSTSTHTGYYQMTKVFWQCRYSKDTLTLVPSAAAGRQRCFRWLWAPSLTHTHQQQGLCALCSTAVNTSYQQPHTRETQHRASNHVATAQLSCLTAIWVLGSSAVTLKSLILIYPIEFVASSWFELYLAYRAAIAYKTFIVEQWRLPEGWAMWLLVATVFGWT